MTEIDEPSKMVSIVTNRYTNEDYVWVTEQLVAVANQCCDGRVVSVLEGGYAWAPSGNGAKNEFLRWVRSALAGFKMTSFSSPRAAMPSKSVSKRHEAPHHEE